MQEVILINRHQVPSNWEISETVAELVTISARTTREPTISEIKKAIRSINSYKVDEVWISSPNSPYDCTGQSFTVSLELVHKSIGSGYVNYTFKHLIGIDI